MAKPEAAYLVVSVEGEQFGIESCRVETVVGYRRPTLLPGRPAPFVGALNHHGELLPVAALAVILGRKAPATTEGSVIVVVRWEDALLGLWVERAQGLLTPMERARLSHVLGRWDGPFLLHTLEAEGQRVHVLDLDAMLADVARRLS